MSLRGDYLDGTRVLAARGRGRLARTAVGVEVPPNFPYLRTAGLLAVVGLALYGGVQLFTKVMARR